MKRHVVARVERSHAGGPWITRRDETYDPQYRLRGLRRSRGARSAKAVPCKVGDRRNGTGEDIRARSTTRYHAARRNSRPL